MREWLLLGVLALGGILGIWLLIFKSLAALYELWQSGREFDRLKRDAASRRMQRPSELMQKKPAPVSEADSNTPVIPQALLDSLSDDTADPLMVPRKRSAAQAAEQSPAPTEPPATPAASPPLPAQPPQAGYDPSATTYSEPEFPLPLPANDDLILDADTESTKPPATPPADDVSDRPPRYDE